MGDDDRGDRPKLSWAEIDKRRDSARGRQGGASEPRGKAAKARARQANEHQLATADALFSLGQGGAEGEELANAMRDAHGSADFVPACREYREKIGTPSEALLLSLWLDAGEADLVVAALEALLEMQRAGQLEVTAGLKSQTKILAQDFNNDIAEAAEELLEGF